MREPLKHLLKKYSSATKYVYTRYECMGFIIVQTMCYLVMKLWVLLSPCYVLNVWYDCTENVTSVVNYHWKILLSHFKLSSFKNRTSCIIISLENMIAEILKGSLTIQINLENRRYLRCINRYTIIGNLCSKVRALALTIRRKYVTWENHVNARESSDIYIMISTRCEI